MTITEWDHKKINELATETLKEINDKTRTSDARSNDFRSRIDGLMVNFPIEPPITKWDQVPEGAKIDVRFCNLDAMVSVIKERNIDLIYNGPEKSAKTVYELQYAAVDKLVQEHPAEALRFWLSTGIPEEVPVSAINAKYKDPVY